MLTIVHILYPATEALKRYLNPYMPMSPETFVTETQLFGDFYWLPFCPEGTTTSVAAGTVTNQKILRLPLKKLAAKVYFIPFVVSQVSKKIFDTVIN